ncbi:hypothetical protein ACSHDQ_003222, partial [Edwardsiella ictaluri]
FDDRRHTRTAKPSTSLHQPKECITITRTITKMKVNIGTTPLQLSNERVTKIMRGDKETATHRGLWARFKDSFNTEKRQDALNGLFDLVTDGQEGVSSYMIFQKLSGLTAPHHRPLFTIAIEPEQADYKISYCISGHPVKSEILSSEKKALLLTQLGLQHDKEYVNGPVFSLEGYRKEISDSQLAQLTDDKFGAGGVHKRFEPKTGVLQARDQTGCADFDCEGRVQGYADDNAELQQYISTQQRIPTPPSVSPQFDYAQVALYDSQQITTRELDRALSELSGDQSKTIAIQLLDMTRAFYCGQLSHRDLHMHNLLVHQRNSDSALLLKAIDFGLCKFGDGQFQDHRFNDINYLFMRQANSAAESFVRNSVLTHDADVMKKHYPLHKLLEHCGHDREQVNKTLQAIGERLCAGLRMAGDDSQRINGAFECASLEVLMAFGNGTNPLIQAPPMKGAHVPTYV